VAQLFSLDSVDITKNKRKIMTMKITKIIGGACALLVGLLLAGEAQSFSRNVMLPVLQQSPAYIVISGHTLTIAQVFTLTVSLAVASVALIFFGSLLLIRRRNAA
jgi:ABC-type uncharacterized transport system fused permease/ATPase subunit